MDEILKSTALFTPKRIISLWKEMRDSSVQIFHNGRIENLDKKSSSLWREINGERTIKDISQATGVPVDEIIDVISSWKNKGYAILDYSPLSPSAEKSSQCAFDTSLIRSNIDVLFLVPPSPHANTREVPTSNLYPLGIGYLISVIEQNTDYICDAINFWNANTDEDTVEQILKIAKPKAIGLSVMTDNYQNGIIISKIAKQLFPQIITFMGGPHATFRGKEILQNEPSIDYVLAGESEGIIVPFLHEVFTNRNAVDKIDGLIYRSKQNIIANSKKAFIDDLDKLPFPNRGKIQFCDNDEVGLITSRGCPGNCIFCCASKMSGIKYRMRSPENVVKEIKELYECGARKISIIDDTFTIDIPRMYKILSLIEAEKFENIRFSAESRVDVVSYDTKVFSALFNAGFRTIQFGVESGSQIILDKLNKRITIEQILLAVELSAKAGLTPYCTLLIGHPYETADSIHASVAFAKKLIDLGAVVFFSVVTPYPGSRIGDAPTQYGITILSDSYDQYSTDNPIIELPHMSRSAIREAFYDSTIEIAKYYIKTRQR